MAGVGFGRDSRDPFLMASAARGEAGWYTGELHTPDEEPLQFSWKVTCLPGGGVVWCLKDIISILVGAFRRNGQAPANKVLKALSVD